MADNTPSQATTPSPKATKGSASQGAVQLNIPSPLFEIGMGVKGDRATWQSTFTADVSKYPPEIISYLIRGGLEYHLKQASQIAEREMRQEVEAAKEQKRQPRLFDLEARALEAMKERDALFRKGETGKQMHFLGAVDRRALELIKAALASLASKQGLRVDDKTLGDKAIGVLNHPVQSVRFREEALRQIEEERAKASSLGEGLDSILAA